MVKFVFLSIRFGQSYLSTELGKCHFRQLLVASNLLKNLKQATLCLPLSQPQIHKPYQSKCQLILREENLSIDPFLFSIQFEFLQRLP